MNRYLVITLLIVLGVFLAGCSTPASEQATLAPTEADNPIPATETLAAPAPTSTPEVPELTIEQIKNAIFPLEMAREKQIKLENGKYTEEIAPGSASKLIVDLTDRTVFGDLNGDGVNDAAAELVWNAGGSGSFHELAAIMNRGGLPVVLALAQLGDRVIVKSLKIEDGVIVVDMLTQGPGDGMCCPKTPVTLRYKLEGDKLVQTR